MGLQTQVWLGIKAVLMVKGYRGANREKVAEDVFRRWSEEYQRVAIAPWFENSPAAVLKRVVDEIALAAHP